MLNVREIYRSGPPSDPTGKRSKSSRQKSTASKRKTTRKGKKIDPIKAMAVIFGTKTSKKASTIIVDGVSTAVPDGLSVTRRDLKTRSNFTIQADDGQKMVVSVTPAGRTTIKQYTSDGDKHYEQSFSLDDWLKGQEVIDIYFGDMMVDYGGEEEIDYDQQEILDDQALIAAAPKKVSKAYFTIVDKLEELPDSYHNDAGLFYDHELYVPLADEGGVMLKIVLTDIPRKPRLNVDFSDDIKIIKGRSVKEYKLSSTTAVFKYIKKWIESHLRKSNPRRRNGAFGDSAYIKRPGQIFTLTLPNGETRAIQLENIVMGFYDDPAWGEIDYKVDGQDYSWEMHSGFYESGLVFNMVRDGLIPDYDDDGNTNTAWNRELQRFENWLDGNVGMR